jgi:hypothetical protein
MIANGAISNWEKRQPKREDSSAERTRAYRERKSKESSATSGDADVTQSDDKNREEKSRENLEPNGSVDSDAADLLGESGGNGLTGDQSDAGIPVCPVQQIVSLYQSCMPENPKVRVLDDKRKKSIRARWKQAALLDDVGPFGYSTGVAGIEAWRKFFLVCADSDFLTGKAKPQSGKPPFFADIDFLMSPDGFKKALENKYHREVKE